MHKKFNPTENHPILPSKIPENPYFIRVNPNSPQKSNFKQNKSLKMTPNSHLKYAQTLIE